MLSAITAIFACQLAGEAAVIAFRLPVPGPVAGMILLFVILSLRGSVPSNLSRVASGLLANLALLFVPAGVGVLQHMTRLHAEGWALAATLLPSTLIAILVTGLVMRWLRERPSETAR